MTDTPTDPHDRDQDTDDPEEGPPDPQLDPTRSPGFGAAPTAVEHIDVGRDVTLGSADPADLTVGDRSPLDGVGIARLVATLRTGTPTERGRAALALADRGSGATKAVSAVSEAALGDEDADVRQFAIEALGRIGGSAAGQVATRLLTDSDPWVRAEAVVALDRIDRDRFAEAIEGALSDDHLAVRRNAAISVFKRQGEDALSILVTQADDPSDRVREWAAHMLGGIDDQRAHETLERLASGDDSEIVRVTAKQSLEVDAARFRRKFVGAADLDRQPLPGEDLLNRRPDL